jgi:signal transduction histidine kinase
MSDKIMLTLGAFVNLTGDAMLIVDPHTRTIPYASPKAIDLIGSVLGEEGVLVSRVFQTQDDRFDRFIRDALTVTEPIISSVSLEHSGRVLGVKGRRLAIPDHPPQILLLLEAEPELSRRFRLLAEKIEELKAQVARRITAERELSETVLSLHRAVSVIKQLSELEISSGEYLDIAIIVIDRALNSRGTVLISVELGRLRVTAATGAFSRTFADHPYLDLSQAGFAQTAKERNGLWRELLFSSLARSGGDYGDFANGMVFPLFISGELRGAFFCKLDSDDFNNASVHLEGEIISEALAGLMARAETEARLMHAQKLQAIGELTGGIAHDFNNILAIVLGNAELLLYELNSIDLDVARDIREAAIRGAILTSRLLSFARKQPLQPEPTDINNLLRQFDPLIGRTLRKDINFELIPAEDLWKVQIDRSQLENAVLNLALNSRDAMPRGGKLTIETSNSQLDHEYAQHHSEVIPGQYVMIAVSDSGHGMDPGVLQEAFTPFFTTKEVGKGSGLGLSMVFGFVKQSLGHVKINSEIGLGTTVRMYFPRDSSEMVGQDTDAVSGNDAMSRARESILVVEDDPGVLKYLTMSLERLGYRVRGLTTGDEAAELMALQTFQLLLTDVVLPGQINGAELGKIAHQIAPTMPVLLMSGYAEESIVHHGRLDGRVNFISKPFTREQLAKRLKGLLEG